MSEASKVTFHGEGPFDLPVAQQVSAARTGNTVALTFRVLVDPSRVEAVRIAVPSNQALDLVGQISRALADS